VLILLILGGGDSLEIFECLYGVKTTLDYDLWRSFTKGFSWLLIKVFELYLLA
jgi:hypothetical protein